MSKEFKIIFLSAAVLAANFAAIAQTASQAPAKESGTATASAAPYNSAFEGYRPFSAEEVGDWRKANDTVREIGGWRAYAREIQGGALSQQGAPAAADAQPQAQSQSQTPVRGAPAPANPHQGHTR